MSLINDALKKAQKQRTGDSPPLASLPSVGGEPAARIARRTKPIGFNSLLLRAGLVAGALLVLVIGGWFFMRSRPAPPVVESVPAKPGTSVAAPPTSYTIPTESPAAASPGLAAKAAGPVTQPQAATPSPQPAGNPPGGSYALPVATPAEQAASAPVVAPPVKAVVKVPEPPAPVAAPKSPPPPAKLEPRAIEYIESIHIAGIRASATDSKVLMNDRVYRIGDIVERDMGLKLTGITNNSLSFADEHGGQYTRTF